MVVVTGTWVYLHEAAGDRDFPDKSQALMARPLGGPKTPPVSSQASPDHPYLPPATREAGIRQTRPWLGNFHVLYCTGWERMG